MKKWIWTLGILAIISISCHVFFKYSNTRAVFSQLKSFPISPETNSYEAGHPLSYFGPAKVKRAVLLLHGFSAAPSVFQELGEELQKQNIPYLAPLITGFGLCDFHLLDVAVKTDWVRDAIFAFDLLASMAEQIDVIGHSNGGSLALILASQRPVNQLIVLDPFLFSAAPLWARIGIETPYLNSIVGFLMPVFAKPEHARISYTLKEKPFEYPGAPMQAYKTLKATVLGARATASDLKKRKSPVFLIYGREDRMVNLKKMVDFFTSHDIPTEIRSYPCSSHDILSDDRQKEVIADILYILQNNAFNPATDTKNDHPKKCP